MIALALLAGAFIFAIGILFSRLLPGRRPALPRSPRPVCGCDHHHSFHDTKTGECHQTVDGTPVHFDKWGDADAWEQVRCTCRRYSGPEPIPSLYAPEIARQAGE
jgi:hypothetical protein